MFWALLVAALVVYSTMVFWSLPRITASAGGRMPFDLRPFGYTLDEARDFLTALPEEGRAFYLGTQHWLDRIYPPLMAAALGLGLWIMSPSLLLRLPLVAVAVAGMVFDLAENHAVASLLSMPLTSIDAEPVMIASAFTTLKSICTTLAMTALLILTIVWAWRKRRRPQ